MGVSGSDLARAAMPALATMTSDSAVILDGSPVATDLRNALGLHGDDAFYAVERTRLLAAMDASAYALNFEALYLRYEPPAGSVAVLVLHGNGAWTGYYLDGELHEIDEVEGEFATREALARQYHETLN